MISCFHAPLTRALECNSMHSIWDWGSTFLAASRAPVRFASFSLPFTHPGVASASSCTPSSASWDPIVGSEYSDKTRKNPVHTGSSLSTYAFPTVLSLILLFLIFFWQCPLPPLCYTQGGSAKKTWDKKLLPEVVLDSCDEEVGRVEPCSSFTATCSSVTFQVAFIRWFQQDIHGHHSKCMINDWTKAAKSQGLKYLHVTFDILAEWQCSLPLKLQGKILRHPQDCCGWEGPWGSPSSSATPKLTAGCSGRAVSCLVVNISKDWDSTTSPGQPDLTVKNKLLGFFPFFPPFCCWWGFFYVFWCSFSETQMTDEQKWSIWISRLKQNKSDNTDSLTRILPIPISLFTTETVTLLKLGTPILKP